MHDLGLNIEMNFNHSAGIAKYYTEGGVNYPTSVGKKLNG
jgi:hypothetical protein